MDIILPSCSKNLARAGQSALSHPFTIEARAEILNEIIQLHVEGTGQGGGRSGRWGGVFCQGAGLEESQSARLSSLIQGVPGGSLLYPVPGTRTTHSAQQSISASPHCHCPGGNKFLS